MGCNESWPLEAICILKRGEKNRIREVSPREAISSLLKQAYIPTEISNRIRALQVLDRICSGVRLFCLECNMEPEAAEVAFNGMKG